MKNIRAILRLEHLRSKWRQTDRAQLVFKIISLSLAVLLHLALILYLKQASIYIKILPFFKEPEAIIATYPELKLPPATPEVIKEPPAQKEAVEPEKARITAGAGTTGRPGRPGAGGGQTETGSATVTGVPAVPFDLEAYLRGKEVSTSSGVRINLSRIKQVPSKYHFSLKLPVRTEPEAGETVQAAPSLKSEVYEYASPRGYLQPGRGLRFTETGKPRPGIPGTVSPETTAGYRYTIKPWAEKVVNLIQARWILPQLSSMPKNKSLTLILVVDRDGQLQSLEIASSTTSEILDQAAVNAVRQCLPFPPLPEDFPGKSLEFYLVFTYHD
ncbi:MAG: TonB family protein [Candidatus Saccharicenans sp.]